MIIKYDNETPTEIHISEGAEVSFSSDTIRMAACKWEDLTQEIQKEFLQIGNSLEVVCQQCLKLLMSDELDDESVMITLTHEQEAILRQLAPEEPMVETGGEEK